MGKGPKKHLKRINAPRSWMLDKLGGTWAPKPSTGPHRMRECIPLAIILRNRLKYALTRREIIMIVMRRSIEIDGKIRTDTNYPVGLMDVVRIQKTGEQFRVLYDVKGRFVLHRITPEEAKYKIVRVVRVAKANKASIGRNPFKQGQAGTIPYAVTHDGRTIRYPDPIIKGNDSIKLDIDTGKVSGHLKFEPGNLAFINKGNNMGRVGVIASIEKHPGSFDIVHLRDKKGNNFATRLANVFVIGEGTEAWISLPKQEGVRLTILEERDARQERKEKLSKKATEKKKKKEKDA
jgi:small subunit ribosomal protein S4e